jgi:hypothetical protein
MSRLHRNIVRIAVLGLALVAAAACSPRRVPPVTVNDLMEDRVVLDGLLMKCNNNPEMARTNVDCANARTAVERLAEEHEAADVAKREAEFEHSREQLRQLQDKQRAAQESATKVDAYHLPVLPVDSSATPAATATPGTPATAAPTHREPAPAVLGQTQAH